MHTHYPPGETSHERAYTHYTELAAAASVPRLLSLLTEAVAALGPEYHDLAQRIRDVLFTDNRPMLGTPPTRDEPVSGCLPDLVLETLPSGQEAWLRPEPSRYTLTDQGRHALALDQLFGQPWPTVKGSNP